MVAEAVEVMADSSAPKKAICTAKGMRSMTSVGRIFWGSSSISAAVTSGMTSTAAVTVNMGINANRM